MRRGVAVLAVVVLAGCGGTAGRRAAPAAPVVPTAPAPPIEAADEPAPELVTELLATMWSSNGQQSSGGTRVCLRVEGDSSSGDDCTMTPEEQAQFDAQFARVRAAFRPAPDSPPRVVAKLRLDGGGNALFVVWRNAAGTLCTETDTDGGGGG